MAIILSSGNYYGVEKQFNENISFKLNVTQYHPLVHIPEHYHENAYLSLLINGTYQEVNKKEANIIAPGEILFRPAGYTHANNFLNTGGQCLNIELKSELFHHHGLSDTLPKVPAIYRAGTFEYLYRILYSFKQDDPFLLSEEYIFNWLAENAISKVPLRLLWLAKAKTILENEFETHHTIQSIADRVFVHPIYLARAFREKEGITIGEYQLKMRVKKAVGLLFTTPTKVADIAYSAGFTDAAHLIRSFRLYYQITPGKFRQILKS